MSAIGLQVPLQEQLIILEAIKEQPPSEALEDCKTNDQKQHWRSCRLRYELIHDSLKAYFSGNSSPLQSLLPEEQQFTELWRDYYLALYSVLHNGWNFISEAIHYSGMPTTPGEMLIRLIKWDGMADLVVAFPQHQRGNFYEEFSPRQSAEFYREGNKVQALLANGKELSPKENNRVAKYQKELAKQKERWSKFSNLRERCLEICREQAKKGSSLKRQLEQFDRIGAEIERLMVSHAHPRKQPQGWAWRQGKKLQSAPGGTYQ